jgi:hypothetical protein
MNSKAHSHFGGLPDLLIIRLPNQTPNTMQEMIAVTPPTISVRLGIFREEHVHCQFADVDGVCLLSLSCLLSLVQPSMPSDRPGFGGMLCVASNRPTAHELLY